MDDELGQDLERTLRVALTAAAQVVEQLVRRQREIERLRSQQNRVRANELQAQFTAERETARALYARINDQRWWSTATTQQVADAYAAADAWTNFDPRAAAAADYMRERIQEKWGVAPDALQPADRARRNQDQNEVAEEQRDRTTLQGGSLATATQQQIERLEREAVDVAQEGRALIAELNRTVDELGQQLPDDARQVHAEAAIAAKGAAALWEAEFQGWYDAAPDTYTKYRNADWMKDSSLRTADEWRRYEADLLQRRELTDGVLGRGKLAAEQLQSTVDVLQKQVGEHSGTGLQTDATQVSVSDSRTTDWVQKTEDWHASHLETSKAINADHRAELKAALDGGVTYETASNWLRTHAPKSYQQYEAEIGWSDTRDGRLSAEAGAIRTYVTLRRRPPAAETTSAEPGASSDGSGGPNPKEGRGRVTALSAATEQRVQKLEREAVPFMERTERMIARQRDAVDHLRKQLPDREKKLYKGRAVGAHQAAKSWESEYRAWHMDRLPDGRNVLGATLLDRHERTSRVVTQVEGTVAELASAIDDLQQQLESKRRFKRSDLTHAEASRIETQEWLEEFNSWRTESSEIAQAVEAERAAAHAEIQNAASEVRSTDAGKANDSATAGASAPTYEAADAPQAAARTNMAGDAATQQVETTSAEPGASLPRPGEPNPKERPEGNRGSHGLQAEELPLELTAASGEAKAAAAPGFPGGAYDILAKGGSRSKKIKPRKIRKPGRENDLGL